jgi:uncharacterized C2H2 Zn-finger protein
MGEYADLRLDGHACVECGEVFHDNAADGLPRYCGRCFPQPERARTRHVRCPACARTFRDEHSLAQHRAMKGH